MVWRSDGPQGAEADKVRHEVVQYFTGQCLDIGCGPRRVFPARYVVGIDSNKDAGLFGIPCDPSAEIGPAEKINRLTESVDTVFSSHTLEHCADYRAVLAEWWRVLRPGGHLVLYLPCASEYPNRGMPGANPDHLHDFMPGDITAAMQQVAWRSGKGWEQLRDEVRTARDEYSFLQVYRKRGSPACSLYHPQPRPEKSLGIVRLGAYGDALWVSSILPALKAEGWHITLYTQRQGEASLRHDPHLDAIVVQPDGIYGTSDAENARLGWPTMGELQGRHIQALAAKHDRLINLIGSVEGALLPHPTHPVFWLPTDTRRALISDRNYVEVVHRAAGLRYDPAAVRVRFYPSEDEERFARAAVSGRPFVVINPSGSSAPKWWPHAQRAMELLAAAGVRGVLLGDTKGHDYAPPEGWQVAGTQWSIRQAYAVAMQADAVIGVESAIVNAVAHEPLLKVVLLSHSSPANLTRDWHRTIALHPEGLPCYPCHRIHPDFSTCTPDPELPAAACAAAMDADSVVGYVLEVLNGSLAEAA